MNSRVHRRRFGIIYIPVFAVLGLFALDKLVLLQSVRECCTKYGGVNAYRASLNYEFPGAEAMRQAAQTGKKIALNFGTSPSFGYYVAPSPEQIAASPHLSFDDRELLTQWEIFNQAYAGASMLTAFVRVYQWLDHGVRPDLIMVEISPAALNQNNIWYESELQNGVPLDFMFRHIADMYPAHVAFVLRSRLIAVTRFRPGIPETAALNFENLRNEVAVFTDARPRGIPLPGGTRPGEESPFERGRNEFILMNMRRQMFSDYRMEPGFARYLERIANRASREKIPLLFWFPPTHPGGLAVIREALDSPEWKERVRKIQELGAVYVDLNEPGVLRCDYFQDPVHVDPRCIPEIAARKLSRLRASGLSRYE